MTKDQATQLRAPFDKSQIGILPRSTSKDNRKGQCSVCGGFHGLPAVHLDYVGHAAVTERFGLVDPDWTWAPMARDAAGMPLLDAKGGLWITLTICGVTRPGYGDETNGKGMKEIIGDALRNAGMRFGVALDLWSKQELVGITTPDGGEDDGAPETVTDDQLGVLRDMIQMTSSDEARFCGVLKVPTLEALPAERYPVAMSMLNDKAKRQAQA